MEARLQPQPVAVNRLVITGMNVNAWNTFESAMEWMADESKAGGAQSLPQVCCLQETRIKSDTKQVSAMSWG
eukprot:1086858-Pyramimonas_sp.AAC.1